MGEALFPRITYPHVLGGDVAGEVVDMGSDVYRNQIGARVVGHAVGLINKTSEGAFQAYTVLLAHIASPLPDTISYESAAVLPLGLSTAACRLFQKDCITLQYPSVPSKIIGKALIFGGRATSVDSNGVQLAVAAGYEVVTTTLPKNFDYVKKLDASQVFDYNSKRIVDKLIDAFKVVIIAGALAVGNGAAVAEACVEVDDKSES